MLVNKNLANLVYVVRVFAFIGVVVLNEEPTVASLDNGLGVRLDFRRNSKNFTNLAVKCALFAVKDVAVRVGGFVAVVY
jgi:hypothetical protein